MRLDSPYLDPQVASAYERLAAPSQFATPARDLVALLDVPPGATVLDVGSGTGVVATALAEAVGAGGNVGPVDPSAGLLPAAGPQPSRQRIGPRAPRPPFSGEAFHAGAATLRPFPLPRYTR